MSFKSLYKLFVMNNINSFNDLYNQRFNSSATEVFDLFIKEYQCFFHYDKDVMNKLASIRSINYELEKIMSKLPELTLKQYLRKVLIDEVEYTNKIEGVISTRKDINEVIIQLENNIKSKDRFFGIVNKYLMMTKEEINLKKSIDVRKLYEEMLYKEIIEEDVNNTLDGKIFRKNIVHVYKSNDFIVHNGIMPEDKIIDYMDKCLDILNNDSLDVLIRIAIVHYLFSYVHPFYDGNGRINRFISSYYISKYVNSVIGFRLSITINENLTQYLDAFKHTNDIRNRADVTTFVYEFLDIVYISCKNTLDYMIDKYEVYNKYKELIFNLKIFDENKNKNQYINILYCLMQNSLFGNFGISKKQISTLISKAYTKTTEYLCYLKTLDLIDEVRIGKHLYYKVNLNSLNHLK